MNKDNKPEYVVDIETMINCFVVCGVDIHSEKKFHYVLWKNKNDMQKLQKFLRWCADNEIIHITFNGLAFDSQILQYIMNNPSFFSDIGDVDAMIDAIYKKAQECINKSSLGLWQDFAPWQLEIPQQDIFKMNHWDSPAKMTSLKWVQCSMDWPNLEDMPYSHTHYVENEEQLATVVNYCYNDVFSTKKAFFLSKEGVDLRRDLTREYGIDLYSASEPRMSKELFLHFLSQKTGADKREMKKWSTAREKINVSDIILPYVNFQTQEFIMLLNNFKTLVINGSELKSAFKYKVRYRGLEIDYGVGGIHGFSKPNKYFATAEKIIMTSDVKSYYPNLAIQNKWGPAHINRKAFCEQYEWFYIERQKHKKGSAKNYALKILLNSTFGLSIDKNSFLSDPQLGCQITINGQLLLTMLLEMLCNRIPEAKPLVMNTDGLEMMIPKGAEQTYLDVCKEWEELTKLELEHDKYKSIFAFDCNNYIAVPENGKAKCKGRFEYEPHDKYDTNVLHKNKSFLVVCKGIYEYFVNGIDPETFVKGHRNIYDFCGYARAKGQSKFVEVKSEGGTIIERPIQKTLRYFMSSTGSKVIKTFPPDKKNPQGRRIQVEAGKNHITPFNKYEVKEFNSTGYNIDYNFYVKEIQKEIKTLERQQTSLFDEI